MSSRQKFGVVLGYASIVLVVVSACALLYTVYIALWDGLPDARVPWIAWRAAFGALLSLVLNRISYTLIVDEKR